MTEGGSEVFFRSSRDRQLLTGGLRMLVLFLVVHAIITCFELARALTLKTPVTYTEAVIVLSAVLSHGVADAYDAGHLHSLPIILSIYGPLYYLLLKFSMAFAGASAKAGRLISILGIGLVTLQLWWFGKRDRLAALLAPLLFLALFSRYVWGGSLAKPDYVGVAFSLLAVLLFVRDGEELTAGRVIRLGYLCVAALLCKPSLLAGTGSIALVLLLRRDWKNLTIFGATVAGLVGPIVALMNALSHGGFWTMAIAGNSARPSALWWWINVRSLLGPVLLACLTVTVIALRLILRTPKLRSERSLILAIYPALSLAWFLFAITRPGSSSSYFLESATALTLATAWLLARAELGWGFKLALAIMLMLCSAAELPGHLLRVRRDDRSDIAERIAQALAAVPPEEPVLSDVYFVDEVYKSHHLPAVNDSAQLTLMVDNHHLSDQVLMDGMQSGSIRHALLSETPEWHLRRGYGVRYWPVDVMGFVRDNFDCHALGPAQIFVNQFDAPLQRKLVFCESRFPARTGSR